MEDDTPGEHFARAGMRGSKRIERDDGWPLRRRHPSEADVSYDGQERRSGSDRRAEGVAADLAEELDTWRRAFATRLDKFEQALAVNTETTDRVDKNTRELVSILQSWKGAMKVMDFLGKLAKPVGYVLGLVTSAVGLWFAFRAK